MPVQPSILPVWNTALTNNVTPSAGKQAAGYVANEIPSSATDNWFQNLVYQWTQYLQAPVGAASSFAAGIDSSSGNAIQAAGIIGRGKNAASYGVLGIGNNTSQAAAASALGSYGAASGAGVAGTVNSGVALVGVGSSGASGLFSASDTGIAASLTSGTGIAANLTSSSTTSANPVLKVNSGASFGAIIEAGTGLIVCGSGASLSTAISFGAGGAVVGYGQGSAVGVYGRSTAYYGVVGYTEGSSGAGVLAQSAGTGSPALIVIPAPTGKAAINITAQATPGSNTTGDIWSDSSAGNRLSFYNGSATVNVTDIFFSQTVANSTTIASPSASFATFSNGSFSVPAGVLKVGSVIEIEYEFTTTTTASASVITDRISIFGTSVNSAGTYTCTASGNVVTIRGRARLQVRTLGASGTLTGIKETVSYESGGVNNTKGLNVLCSAQTINTTTSPLPITIDIASSTGGYSNAILYYARVRVF